MIELPVSYFGRDTKDIDDLYCLLSDLKPEPYALDLHAVSFLKPPGVMALLLAVRQIKEKTGHPVSLLNLDNKLKSYLERVNLFDIAKAWLHLDEIIPETRWDRNPESTNLLELTPITNALDVAQAMERAEAIFSHWLQMSNLSSLLKVISELCSNIYQHSGDPHGFVLIQRYQYYSRSEVEVVLAAGDLGKGIRGSLQQKHPQLDQNPLSYIQAAMNGTTSRGTGRGGLGLRTVEETVAKEGGSVWLRTETAALRSFGPTRHYPDEHLAFMPGTQVVVEFHAPLRD